MKNEATLDVKPEAHINIKQRPDASAYIELEVTSLDQVASYLRDLAISSRGHAMNQKTVKETRYYEGVGAGYDLAARVLDHVKMASLDAVKRNAWYIDNALTIRIEHDTKVVTEAKKILESEENDGSAPYRSLDGMVQHIGQAVKDFTKAHRELREAGVK